MMQLILSLRLHASAIYCKYYGCKQNDKFQMKKLYFLEANLKIFLFPLAPPCFSGMGRSVGNYIFLFSQIPYPLNLIVNSPNMGNKTKYTNNAN